MNNIVADQIAQALSALSFITVSAGTVTALPIASLKGNVPATLKTYPVNEPNVCEINNGYFDLTPLDRYTGISFFEDKGAKLKKTSASVDIWEGKLQLIVWLNFKKIGNQNQTGSFYQKIKDSIPVNVTPLQHLRSCSTQVIETPNVNPFNKYAYKQDKNLFLIHPYGYRVFSVKYVAAIAKGCTLEIVLNPEQC